MLKIVYGGNRYYDHDPAQGFAFDHSNIYDSLRRMPGVEVVYFVYDRVREIGAPRINEELIALVKKEKPDLFLSIMYHEDLTLATLDELRKHTITLGYFMDDQWHFENSSRLAAPHLSWVATTYSGAVPKYEKLGCRVIRTHLGANHKAFTARPEGAAFKYDATFVGAWWKKREKIIGTIQRAGIDARAWGPGWPSGRLPDVEMVPLVHATKVNLDINPSASYAGLKPLLRFFLKREKGKFRFDFGNIANNIREWWNKRIPMIKPRTFNCLAARSFVIIQMTHDLSEFYEIDKEIVAYSSVSELIQKIRYYLAHEEERERIAEAGHRRTLCDHTYEKRFRDMFEKIGVAHKLDA